MIYLLMDYYSDKYEKMCLTESSDYSVDLVVKGNKIYKVKNYRFTISDQAELSELIESLTIDKNYVLKSSHSDLTTLYQVSTNNYVNIHPVHENNSTGMTWEIEYVEPELLGNSN